MNGIIFVLEMACMTCMFLIDTIHFERKHNLAIKRACFGTETSLKSNSDANTTRPKRLLRHIRRSQILKSDVVGL